MTDKTPNLITHVPTAEELDMLNEKRIPMPRIREITGRMLGDVVIDPVADVAESIGPKVEDASSYESVIDHVPDAEELAVQSGRQISKSRMREILAQINNENNG